MPEFHWILAYLLLGGFVGLFAGLLGVGGGGIMVPVLTAIFAAQSFPSDQLVHLALGTSMASIIITALSSLKAHHSHQAVLWPIVIQMTPGILVGTFAATFVAAYVGSKSLALFFVCFMTLVSVQMILNKKPRPGRQLPGTLGMAITGGGIGAISALVAIGGGSLSVPFMTWCNVKLPKAIGTSAAIGLPIAIAGTVGFIISGMNMKNPPDSTFGFIYLPAVAMISLVSVFTAPLGAKLAHSLPISFLKKIFAALLFALSLKMLHSIFI